MASKPKPKIQTAAGANRKRFMESDQPLALWRGRPARHTDRKKQANRQACRGKNFG